MKSLIYYENLNFSFKFSLDKISTKLFRYELLITKNSVKRTEKGSIALFNSAAMKLECVWKTIAHKNLQLYSIVQFIFWARWLKQF